MIVGLGIDLVELERIERSLERFGRRFLDKVLTRLEQEALPSSPGKKVEYVAARFAAKEAASKALGTGFSQGITPLCIELLGLPTGQPELVFHGAAAKMAGSKGVKRRLVSLTHSRTAAAAVVILEN